MKKSIFTLIILLGFSSCGSNSYYVLSTPSTPTKTYTNHKKTIGVEKVTVPQYLYKREIAIAKSSSQVTFISSGIWAEDLDKGLTNRVISFLQKKFNQPNVYIYPWDMTTQPNINIKLHITRFIAQGDKVYLNANWKIESMYSTKSKSKLFSITVPTTKEEADIVSSMDKAFAILEEDLAVGVRGF